MEKIKIGDDSPMELPEDGLCLKYNFRAAEQTFIVRGDIKSLSTRLGHEIVNHPALMEVFIEALKVALRVHEQNNRLCKQ